MIWEEEFKSKQKSSDIDYRGNLGGRRTGTKLGGKPSAILIISIAFSQQFTFHLGKILFHWK